MRELLHHHRYITIGALVLAAFVFFFHTPFNPPNNPIIIVAPGEPFSVIADDLHAHGIITSPFVFRIAAMVAGGTTDIKAGTYRFDYKEHMVTVARRLITADYGIEPVRVVFPEGSTAYEMAKIIGRKLDLATAVQFVDIGRPLEGSLFPDTYMILPTATSGEIVVLLRSTFDDKTKELQLEAASSTHSWEEVLTMASILEEEVRTLEDRRIVSGILWKRIEAGMRLQVDASFSYLFGKASADVTLDDIATDSPYNTYRFEGLPPGPITNPGLTAIEAALNPIESDYWFFLSDAHGTTRYARTYEEHLENVAKYID